jgi:hypothetical protein
MTTIIGIQGDGFALVCTDSQVSDIDTQGYATQIATLRESASKIASNGRYLLGAAGDVRAINILHHAFTPPTAPANLKGKRLDHFMTVKFIPALRECFETQGYAIPQSDSSEHIAEQGSSIIVVINGIIYVIDGTYSWYSDTAGFYAIGTGAQYALGAIASMVPKGKLTIASAKKMAIKAIAIAAKFDPYTGFPYHTQIQEAEVKPKV